VTADSELVDTALEQPILWLGISGFAPAQRAALEAWLDRPAGLPRWRVCAFGDADAWWVNGTKVRLMPGGNLKVAAGLPTEHALNLNLGEVDRPVAFATPLAAADFEPRCSFDPASEPSVQAVLLQFDRWLRLVRSQFVLGKQLIERRSKLGSGVYHVSHRGTLLAVLDFHGGKVALSPGVHPVELWEAQWHKRPIGAGGLPPKFLRCTPGQLAWAYVRRTDRDMLPPRYRTGTVYYRGVPQVPVGWLQDSQLMLLRELATEPGNIASLRERTGLPAVLMAQDLSCLYCAGAITTTRAKAAVPLAAEGQPNSIEPDLNSLLREGAPSYEDLTAPALLEHRRFAERTSDPDSLD
jgi:hypothetical protein